MVLCPRIAVADLELRSTRQRNRENDDERENEGETQAARNALTVRR